MIYITVTFIKALSNHNVRSDKILKHDNLIRKPAKNKTIFLPRSTQIKFTTEFYDVHVKEIKKISQIITLLKMSRLHASMQEQFECTIVADIEDRLYSHRRTLKLSKPPLRRIFTSHLLPAPSVL